MKVTLGADPEFFVKRSMPLEVAKKTLMEQHEEAAAGKLKKKPRNDPEYTTYVPICGLLGGTKAEPQQIQGLPKGYLQQEDGAAVEFNIPPETDPVEFAKSISKTMRHLYKILVAKGLDQSNIRTIELTKEVLEKFPNLGAIGCDPDFSAYTNLGQPRGTIPADITNVRGAGGHLHIGYDKDVIPPIYLVKFLDLCITLPLLEFDVQGKRRKWWGQAGIYRNKTYGLEYRSLSNFWLFNETLSYAVAKQVFDLLESLEANMIAWQEVYNACNWDAIALHINNENGSEGKKLLHSMCSRNKVLSNLINGMRSIM